MNPEEIASWFERHLHHQDMSAAPAAAAVTIKPTTREDPVSFIADLKADGRAFMAKLESVDEATLNALEAVLANPKTAEAFQLISAVAHVDPGPYFDLAVNGLKLVAGLPPATAAATTGPVVGGQA